MPESARPSVLPSRPWHFPSATETTLDNGLHVMAFQCPGQYVVSAGLVLDIPLSAEERSREGVGALLAHTLDEGTRRHPGLSFTEAMEDIGADFGGHATYDATHVQLGVPVHNLNAALDLMAEAVMEPTLTDDDVMRQRGLRLSQLEQSMAQPGHRATAAIRSAVFHHRTRAARIVGGFADTVSRITADDVRSFHATYYGPRRSTLVLAGDFATDPVEAVASAFGCWRDPGTDRPADDRNWGRSPDCILVDRPGSVQAEIRLGALGIDRRDPRWPDMQVASYALGGAFLSRLNSVLREERGFTYGVHLVSHPHRYSGLIAMQGSFRNEVVLDALALAQDLLDVRQRPFTDVEVEEAVTFTRGVTPLRFATAEGVVGGVTSLASVGLRPDFITQDLAALGRVTPASATRAAETILAPDRLSLAIVGEVAHLAPALESQGWSVQVTS